MKTVLIICSIIAIASCIATTPVPDKATAQLLVKLHNTERQLVGVRDLTWSDDLSNSAQAWANYLASTRQFYHSGTAGLGENIVSNTFRDVPFLFSQWSNEKKYFNPSVKYGSSSTTDSRQMVGHYTQVVWSMTSQVGCGIANSTYQMYLVCQYKFPGNSGGNWVYKPNPSNPWKALQPAVDPTTLMTPSPNSYPTLLDSASVSLIIDLHNTERSFVGMNKMTWSSTLAASAQAHANKQAKAGTFYLSMTAGVGENMQMAAISPDIMRTLFNMWANEKVNFDATLQYPQCAIGNKMISHYTQIVWSTTTEFGCGMATNSANALLVCQYTSMGNYYGNYVVYPAPKVNFKFIANDPY